MMNDVIDVYESENQIALNADVKDSRINLEDVICNSERTELKIDEAGDEPHYFVDLDGEELWLQLWFGNSQDVREFANFLLDNVDNE